MNQFKPIKLNKHIFGLILGSLNYLLGSNIDILLKIDDNTLDNSKLAKVVQH